MANGVSCAYFAVRNLFYGKKENNLFKEGIGVAQTVRTADAATNIKSFAAAHAKQAATAAGVVNKPKSVKFCEKMLYPLIIASGVYNTIKSEDKVKTGISQGVGIASMRCFEKTFENIIKGDNSKLIKKIKTLLSEESVNKIKDFTNKLPSNKYGKILKYVLQGALFATVSMTGYNVGSGIASKIVDKVRENKIKDFKENDKIQSGYTSPKYNENIFEDIEVIEE